MRSIFTSTPVKNSGEAKLSTQDSSEDKSNRRENPFFQIMLRQRLNPLIANNKNHFPISNEIGTSGPEPITCLVSQNGRYPNTYLPPHASSFNLAFSPHASGSGHLCTNNLFYRVIIYIKIPKL